jgi:enamine deaminase RidA (YjgF/YER057c/UK114 family)
MASGQVVARLAERGLSLPPYPDREGAYRRVRILAPFAFVSAHGPILDGKVAFRGRVGSDLSLEEGREAARLTTLNILSSLQAHVTDLEQISMARLFVMVQAGADFSEHHLVADAASQLLTDALGADRGAHSRAAVGMVSLPMDMAVNIDAIATLDP